MPYTYFRTMVQNNDKHIDKQTSTNYFNFNG